MFDLIMSMLSNGHKLGKKDFNGIIRWLSTWQRNSQGWVRVLFHRGHFKSIRPLGSQVFLGL